MDESKPNHTLYIKNLPEKLKKEDLKKTLAQLFSPFGTIVDILVFNNLRMRGQAHVIFKDLYSAANAIVTMKDYLFFNKPMRIQFARENSKVIAASRGENFDRPNKIIGCERVEKSKKKKTAKIIAQSFKMPKSTSSAMEISLPAAAVKNEVAPPHKILYVTRIPPDYDPKLLRQLFLSFAGLRDVRLIEGRPDIAFVEFESELHATVVKRQLNKYHIIPDHPLSVVYANK